MMKITKFKSLIFLLFMLFNIFGQTNNFSVIDSLKTKENVTNINKYILGCWVADKKYNSDGKAIELDGFETSYCFKKDSISFIGKDIINNRVSGKYYYDEKGREIRIMYINPIIPGKGSIPDAFLDSLLKKKIINPITFCVIDINKISDTELVVIEYLPHDEKTLSYNLVYYIKKSIGN